MNKNNNSLYANQSKFLSFLKEIHIIVSNNN